MLRIAACAMLWLCSGCAGDLFERPILWPLNDDKTNDKSPTLVRDETKPGQPVISAYLSGARVTDADMKGLADLKQLRTLDLRNTSVTDAGLKVLANFSQLRELYLIRAGITDAGLKEVASLKELKKLYLVDTKVTDAGLKSLVKLKHLEELNVSDTMVTNDGLEKIQSALPACQVVDRNGWPR